MVGSSGFSSTARSRCFTASSIVAGAVIGPAERVDDVAVVRPLLDGAADHLHAFVEIDALIDPGIAEIVQHMRLVGEQLQRLLQVGLGAAASSWRAHGRCRGNRIPASSTCPAFRSGRSPCRRSRRNRRNCLRARWILPSARIASVSLRILCDQLLEMVLRLVGAVRANRDWSRAGSRRCDAAANSPGLAVDR